MCPRRSFLFLLSRVYSTTISSVCWRLLNIEYTKKPTAAMSANFIVIAKIPMNMPNSGNMIPSKSFKSTSPVTPANDTAANVRISKTSKHFFKFIQIWDPTGAAKRGFR